MDHPRPSPPSTARPVLGWALAVLWALSLAGRCPAQVPPEPADQPAVAPASGGPTHEATLSSPRDPDPAHADKSPPAAINERPGLTGSSPKGLIIPGYWEWDPASKSFAWVGGITREPPPGRFWANGYWWRDDQGWSRVPGFWSDRRLDEIAWSEEGPPAEHPQDEPGPPPGEGRFFIPGHFVPEGKDLMWREGFWTRAQPGWSWTLARWVHQPEGWTFQGGFWDRPAEARGTRLVQVRGGDNARMGDTGYRPSSVVASGPSRPLNGRNGSPNPLQVGASSRPRALGNPGILNSFDTPSVASSGFVRPTLPTSGNNLGYSSVPSMGSGFGGYPYYGHGLGTSPGYYGGSAYGSGLGYYPGYYGGSGTQDGRSGIEQGGLGGYPYYGHGLGYYPGYFGQ